MLMNSDGEILIDSTEVKHNFEDFEKIRKQLEIFDVSNVNVTLSSPIIEIPVTSFGAT